MLKLRIGVLMGGRSNEHEVSFNSGRTVCDHIDASSYDIIPIFQTNHGALYILPWQFLYRGKTTDFTHRLATEAECITWDNLKYHIDFAFIAMHGQYAEDGRLQGFLEILGLPYLGSKIFASALGMNKVIQKTTLRMHGIRVPQSLALQPNKIKTLRHDTTALDGLCTELAHAALTFPLVIKPAGEGSSLGVSIVNRSEDLLKAIIAASSVSSKSQPILIEEQIIGMEFSCVCLTDATTNQLYALTPTEIVPENSSAIFCYTQKYMPGRATKYTPARCTEEQLKLIQKTCVSSMYALGMTNIARIDGFLTSDNHVIIVDPNSLPGMGPSSFLFREAAEYGMDHHAVINHLIETELHEYGIPKPTSRIRKDDTMEKQEPRIIVILGGNSNERETSLESGRNIVYKLSSAHYNVQPLFLSEQLELFKISPQQLIRNSTQEIQFLLKPDDRIEWHALPQIADFVYIALHGGIGENGVIQGTLEMLNIPYNGSSVLASALCMHKYKTNQFLHAHGFSTPKGTLISKKDFFIDREAALKTVTEEISFPVIIKPHDDGCSFMVQKACSIEALNVAIDQLFTQGKDHALVEECITGMELTVGCIGNDVSQALPPSQIISSTSVLSLEEKFLPGAGENQTPAPLSTPTLRFIQKEIERIYTTLNCKGYARIDCFYQDALQSPTGSERLICIEVNTLPGMTPATVLFHQAAEINMSPTALIERIITLGFELHTPEKYMSKDQVMHAAI